MRKFIVLGVAGACALLAACAQNSNGPTLPQIQAAGAQFTATVKTDVTLYEAQTTLPADVQSKITIALDSLTAANVVLQNLTPTATPANYIGTAEQVVNAAVSVVNALPSGTVPANTLAEIDAGALAFQLAAGLAQQTITAAQTPAPAPVPAPAGASPSP